MAALRFLPPLGWTALILWLATADWSAAETAATILPLLRMLFPWAVPEQVEALHWLIRKTGHVVEYAVLVALWRYAMARSGEPPRWHVALGVTVLTAALDEVLQATTPVRGGSAVDVLLDSAAAGTALALLSLGARRTVDWLTGALLWLSAAGGTALLAVSWGAGASWGWLAWSVPVAWVALVLWHRKRRPA